MLNVNTNQLTETKLNLLELHADRLARMKARGNSASDMLAWLRRKGISCHAGELAAFWKRHEQNGSTPQISSVRLPPSLPTNGSNPNSEQPETLATSDPLDLPKLLQATSSGLTSGSEMDAVMGLYRQLVRNLLEQALKEKEPNPKTVDRIHSMIRTLVSYHFGKIRSDHRERSLKLREARQAKEKNQESTSDAGEKSKSVSTGRRGPVMGTGTLRVGTGAPRRPSSNTKLIDPGSMPEANLPVPEGTLLGNQSEPEKFATSPVVEPVSTAASVPL